MPFQQREEVSVDLSEGHSNIAALPKVSFKTYFPWLKLSVFLAETLTCLILTIMHTLVLLGFMVQLYLGPRD